MVPKRTIRPRRRGPGVTPAVLVLLAALGMPIHLAVAKAPREVTVDGGRGIPVHRIDLYRHRNIDNDETKDVKLGLDDKPVMPFSSRRTCGQCHDYETIAGGWHFNAGRDGVDPGRPGEPWLVTDVTSGTQLPVSRRDWPGTYRPEQVGMDAFEFAHTFGSHLPGGGAAEPAERPGLNPRWWVSGRLQIDCLGCHSADRAYDHSEWAMQISRQNFQWASAAASGLAVVKGTAQKMSGMDTPFAYAEGPEVLYDKSRFGPAGKVFFDVTNDPPAGRCEACHSSRRVDADAGELWQRDADVHLAAGMNCTDCHRNGLDHDIVRGFEPRHASLSCRGCHLGEGTGPDAEGGRLGAPRPAHRGLPALHLEKLTCTACHSGPWPGAKAGRVQTSRSHRMGVHGGYRGAEAPPYILSPVFKRQADGAIAPHKITWPAFWGRLAGGEVTPIPPSELDKAVGHLLKTKATADEPRGLSEARALAAMTRLAEDADTAGEPVYVSAGKLYRLVDGKLVASEHPAAEPYAWPLAHDVRPAAQALGAKACTDCHSADSPFFFGEVTAESPANFGEPAVVRMYELQGLDPAEIGALAVSFQWRTTFKIVGFIAVGVAVLVLIRYGFLGLGGILSRRRPVE